MCVSTALRSFPARVGQSHPVLLLLLLESECQSENRAMKERKSAASRKERSLRNTAALSLLGPLLLYLHPQLPTTARDLLQVTSPVGESETCTKKTKDTTSVSMANQNLILVTKPMKAER